MRSVTSRLERSRSSLMREQLLRSISSSSRCCAISTARRCASSRSLCRFGQWSAAIHRTGNGACVRPRSRHPARRLPVACGGHVPPWSGENISLAARSPCRMGGHVVLLMRSVGTLDYSPATCHCPFLQLAPASPNWRLPVRSHQESLDLCSTLPSLAWATQSRTSSIWHQWRVPVLGPVGHRSKTASWRSPNRPPRPHTRRTRHDSTGPMGAVTASQRVSHFHVWTHDDYRATGNTRSLQRASPRTPPAGCCGDCFRANNSVRRIRAPVFRLPAHGNGRESTPPPGSGNPANRSSQATPK